MKSYSIETISLFFIYFYFVLEKLSLDYQFDDGPFSAVFLKERGSGTDDALFRTESNHTLIWIILNHRDTLVVLKWRVFFKLTIYRIENG